MSKKRKKAMDEIPRIKGTYNLTKAGVEADEIRTRILRRRLQILVHSCIYYNFDRNLISDHRWNEWSRELVELQEKYPLIASRVDYAQAFEGFDGSTGFDLPIRNFEIMNKAQYLLNMNRDKEVKDGRSGHHPHRTKPGGNVIRIKIP